MPLQTSSTAITVLHHSKAAHPRAVANARAEDRAVQLNTKIWWNLIRPDQIHGARTCGVDGALHEPPRTHMVYSKRLTELARPAAKTTAKPRVQTATTLLVMAAPPADEKGLVLQPVEAATKVP